MKELEAANSHSLRTATLLFALAMSAAANFLLVANESFHAHVYGLLSATGLGGVLQQGVLARSRIRIAESERLGSRLRFLESRIAAHDANVKRATTISKRIVARTARNTLLNVSSVMEEAVPYIGAGVVVAVTAADVKAACDNIRDLNKMTNALSDEESESTESEREVCGMKVPSAETVIDEVTRNLKSVVSRSSKQAKESAHTFYNDLGGTLHVIFGE